MLMPSIFGENLFDEMMDSFNDEFFGNAIRCTERTPPES